MAANWDANWDDEEWLKKQNAANLHSIFREAGVQGKDSAKIKKVVVDKLHAVTDFKEVNSYDLLAFLKVADDADLTVTGADNTSRNLKAEIDNVIEARTADLENKTDLISRLNRKALLEAAKITKKADTSAVAVLTAETRSSAVSISDVLENASEITDAEFDAFDNADKAGALDDIADSTKEAFIKKLAELSDWEKTEGRIIEKNDNALLDAVTSLDVYKEDGSLNDIYADCAELADKLTFEYPEGTTDEQKVDLAKAYKQQLLANAAMRATNEVLKDRSLLLKHKTAEDVLNAYKSEVYKQFERGVVVAGLTTNQATGIMLDKITRNKDTGEIEYDGGADNDVKQAIADILEGKSPINPLTLQMDSYQLDIENRKIERILKRKKLDSKKLSFWNKTVNVAKAAVDNIVKKGGWKKVAANMGMFGGAAALMALSGSAVAIGAGVALYTGWTAVNAWVMPAYDTLNNEMYERKTKGFKARLAYIKQNISRAMKAKRAEPGFKKRAWWRTVEGVVVGGLTGGMGLFGITGWAKVFSRQGAMTAGKGTSLIRSLFARKKAEKNLQTTYSMDNFKALQTAEGYLKQDKVALAAVVGGALAADAVKSYMEDGVVADLVSSVKDKVSGLGGTGEEAVATETVETETPEIVETKTEAETVEAAETPESVETKTEVETVEAAETPEVVETKTEVETVEAAEAEAPTAGDTVDHELNANGPYNYKDVDFSKYENLNNYNKDMGITFTSYKTLIQVYGAQELDRMLGALNREGVMDNFKDMGLTKEQLLVRFRGLDATTERVGKDGFSIQGAARYHHEEGMTYLNKLLGPCGDQITPEQYAVIKESLKVMDNKGGYHGEGIVPTTSQHIRAHGYNTGNCSDGQLNQFKLGHRIKAPMHQEMPVTPAPQEPVINVPVEPEITPIDYSVGHEEVVGLVNTTEAPAPSQIDVNFRDPFSRATAYLARGTQDYDINRNIPEGAQIIKMDNKGNLFLWQKGAVVAGSEDGNQVVSGVGGVESIHKTALNLKMNDLGAAEIKETNDVMSFRYGQGKNSLTFVLNKNNGEIRTYLGNIKDKNEIILDQATTARAGIALNRTMHESGLDTRYHLNFRAETEQNNDSLSDYIKDDKKVKIEQNIDDNVVKAVQKGADHGMTTTQFERPDVVPSYTHANMTPAQQSALLSDQAVITSNGTVENGQMVFEVKGVDGVDRLSLPAVRSVSLVEGQHATVVVDPTKMGTTQALHQHTISIPTDKGAYTVEINSRGGTAQVLDESGTRIFLDAESGKAMGVACKEALEANGVKGVGNINLSAYPEGSLGAKCVKIYQTTVNQQRMQNALVNQGK